MTTAPALPMQRSASRFFSAVSAWITAPALAWSEHCAEVLAQTYSGDVRAEPSALGSLQLQLQLPLSTTTAAAAA